MSRPTPETDAFGGNLGDWIKFAEKLERERDYYKWQLHIAKGEIEEARQMERAWKKEETK